jgi:hypothetical protein
LNIFSISAGLKNFEGRLAAIRSLPRRQAGVSQPRFRSDLTGVSALWEFLPQMREMAMEIVKFGNRKIGGCGAHNFLP